MDKKKPLQYLRHVDNRMLQWQRDQELFTRINEITNAVTCAKERGNSLARMKENTAIVVDSSSEKLGSQIENMEPKKEEWIDLVDCDMCEDA
jgi:hypothetical protein